ncbi:MAG TPA: ABC transporter substrate-binding protein [Thermoanaerobaculia bacterium]|nr:ABC transporter substrate-binding protein [Thermoanaerobaculia bacterium]
MPKLHPVSRLLRGAVLLAAALSWMACERRAPSFLETKGGGGDFRILLPSEPQDLDPNSTRDELSLVLAPNLYGRLVMLDADARLRPDLAASWDVGQGGLEYTFHLRGGVRWHDGRPFTSADVRWTLEHLAGKPSFAAETIRRIAAIDTPDERTVVLRLRERWAPLLATLAGDGTFILPRPGPRRLAGGHEVPVGTGPFQFAEWVPGQRIVLTANRSFYRPGPFLDRLVYLYEPDSNRSPERLAAGQADYAVLRPSPAQLPRLARDPRLRVVTSPVDGRYYLAFNLRRPPFGDLRVRQAINHALDRPALLERALYGYGAAAYGFYTPAVAWAYSPDARAPELEPDRARSLLDAAGLAPDARGVRFSPGLLVADITPFQDIARVAADQLRAVGIAVRLESVTGPEWMVKGLKRHDFDMTLIGGRQGPDPESLNMRFGSRSLAQPMGYANPAFDAALAEGARALDLGRRARAYFRAQEILARDLPIAPLAEAVQVTICRREVTGLPTVEGQGLVPTHEYSLVRVARAAASSGGPP